MNKTTLLAEKLISIPSYVGSSCNEKEIGEFIFNYLQKFSWLETKKQFVSKSRFNIISKDKYPTEKIICGHIDTVEPRGIWKNPFIKNGNLYGLGSSDMKGTIASMLSAIEKLQNTRGVMWLFYVDEEYDFLGTKKFIDEYKNEISPKLIIGEGSDCQITNGCRGLIEIRFEVFGKTAHAAQPENGLNAIIKSQVIILAISKEISKYSDPVMGDSTLNVASINGGLKQGDLIGRQGNNIADYCEFIVDIRPATNNLTAEIVIKIVHMAAKKLNVKINSSIRHDLRGWISPVSNLPSKIRNRYGLSNDYQKGYLDIQMLNEAFSCPSFGFGAGLADQAHKENEFVQIKNLKKCTQFYIDLMEGGEKYDS